MELIRAGSPAILIRISTFFRDQERISDHHIADNIYKADDDPNVFLIICFQKCI